MHRSMLSCAALAIAAAAALTLGCEEKPAPAPAKPAPAQPTADHHDHVHGAGTDLGSVTIGALTLKVTQEHAVEEGKDAGFEIAVSDGKPGAVRAWIGAEDAKGSVKGKAVAEEDHLDVHVETPKPIPTGAKLWIEVEDGAGKKSVGSIAYK
jgi:hypothetical protein